MFSLYEWKQEISHFLIVTFPFLKVTQTIFLYSFFSTVGIVVLTKILSWFLCFFILGILDFTVHSPLFCTDPVHLWSCFRNWLGKDIQIFLPEAQSKSNRFFCRGHFNSSTRLACYWHVCRNVWLLSSVQVTAFLHLCKHLFNSESGYVSLLGK